MHIVHYTAHAYCEAFRTLPDRNVFRRPPAHVITRKDERIAVVIKTLVVWAGEADPRDTAEAFAWAREHRVVLHSRWQAYSEEES